MSELKNINDTELNEVSGGTAAGMHWTTGGCTFYRIAAGDTLFDIAERFHTTVPTIAALNPALIEDVDFIQVGWEIRVL